MGSELYRTSPVFRKTADLCAAVCASHRFPAFLDIITSDSVDLSTKNAAQVQLAVVTLEIALTAFWRSSAGIEPSMVMGHSLGEYAALHAAGVLSLTDTLYLIGRRALLLLERCELNSCAMLSMSAPVATVREHLGRLRESSCGVACINSPTATVISGTAEDLARVQTSITTQDANTRTKMLPVPFAFHSFQMDAILPDYKEIARGVTYLAPRIPVASTLLASVVDASGVFSEDYLARQTRQAVDFSGGLDAVKLAFKNEEPLWLEIGPGPVCTSFVRATLSPPVAKINHTIDANNANWATISKSLVAAYTSGVDVDWLAFHEPYERNLELLALPTYAWDVKNYWITHTDKNNGTLAPAAAPAKATVPEPFLTTTAQYLVDKTLTPDGQIKVTFRAGLSDHGFMGVIDGHKMQQIGLASGTVFCDAAATVAKYALEYSGGKTGVTASNLTFHEPKLLAPLTRDLVGIDGDLLTTATMETASSDVISASFKAVSKSGEIYDLGSVLVKYRIPDKAQADLDRVSFFIKAKMEERIRLSKDGSGHRMQPDVFFALFANAVEFSPDFRGVQEAYVAGDYQEAAATIKIRPDPTGARFTASPYWGEALLHLAGFMVNGNPNTPQPLTYALMGYDSIEQLAPVEADKEYLTYTHISRWEGTTAFCSAYVFDAQTWKIVMLAIDLRYQQFKRTTWRHILGTRPHAVGAGPHHAAAKSVSLPPVKETKITHDTLSAAMATVPIKQERKGRAKESSKEQETGDSRAFQIILDSLIAATGSDPSEFTDDAEIADIGVDSIMAIEVVAAVTEKGVDLPASFVFDYQTIGDLRRAFGAGTQEDCEGNDTSSTPSTSDEEGMLSMTPAAPFTPFTPTSPASSVCDVDKEDPSILSPKLESDTSPLPNARITLLQGRPEAGSTPLYMMTDGTGTVASFIHLRPFKSNQIVYGIDSPFLRCPSRMNSKVGIEGVAKLVVDALIKAQSTGPLMIGGYSVGCYVAFEMSRQLAQAGRQVTGLLLIDMPCPRPRGVDQGKMLAEGEASEAVLEGIVNRDGQWSALGSRREHMRQFFVAMNEYSPARMTATERPAKTAVIWAEHGLINRVVDDPAQIQKLEAQGVPTKPYPGFMQDPKLGTFACHVPNKGQENLGPNGWDEYTGGDVKVLSVNGDHFELPMPGHVHLLQEKMEDALAYFSST
jgi:iterative type I PKS product template protein